MTYILCSQLGNVVNLLELLFTIGGLQVVCNLNTLVIDRVTLDIYVDREFHEDIIGCWLE